MEILQLGRSADHGEVSRQLLHFQSDWLHEPGHRTEELSGFPRYYTLTYMLHMFCLYVEVLFYIYDVAETRTPGSG